MAPTINFIVLLATALIPLLLGFIWYHPKVFGNAWMKVAGVTPESAKGANMPLIFVLTFLFGFFIAFTLNFITIHQWGFFSMMSEEPGLNDPATNTGGLFKTIMDNYGNTFRTFKHGAFHGTLTGIFFAWPLIAVNGLFERKGAKYIAINAGYWTLCLTLMGGVVCAFS